jgi:hypothetical protein
VKDEEEAKMKLFTERKRVQAAQAEVWLYYRSEYAWMPTSVPLEMCVRIATSLPHFQVSLAMITLSIGISARAYNVAVREDVWPCFIWNLPRDLRDMVYKYLVVDCIDTDAAPKPGWSPSTANQNTDLDPLRFSFWWPMADLGTQIKDEVTRCVYRTARFCTMPKYEEPDWFLTHDYFGLGLRPYELIRNISSQVHVESDFVDEFQVRKLMVQALAPYKLLGMRGKLQIGLVVHVRRANGYAHDAMRASLGVFARGIRRLLEDRMRVTWSVAISADEWIHPVLLQRHRLTMEWRKEIERLMEDPL